jgi:hypothetical protein
LLLYINMQFVNSRPSNNFYQTQKNNQNIVIPLSNSYKKIIQNNVTPQKNITSIQPQINPQKKMKWGEPTWFLFHTIAEKIKPDEFHHIRVELLNIISIICNNLPCPDCANHASEYMNKINKNAIRSKQDLKLMLFQFHNVVNQKKKFPLFSIDELDSKYSNANTINIIQNFMHHFQDKHHSLRMIANDIHRSRISEQLKLWFNANIQYFDL